MNNCNQFSGEFFLATKLLLFCKNAVKFDDHKIYTKPVHINIDNIRLYKKNLAEEPYVTRYKISRRGHKQIQNKEWLRYITI